MPRLVWGQNGEWKGEPVEAGADLPPMTHGERAELYKQGRAVRAANGKEAAPPPVQVDMEAQELKVTTEGTDGELHQPGKD